MALETFPFDAAESLDTPEEQADLLAEAFASGDPAIVTAALGMIAGSAFGARSEVFALLWAVGSSRGRL